MKKLDAMTSTPAAPKPPDVPAELEAATFGGGPLSGLELARVALGPEDVSERVAPDLRLEESTLRGIDLTGTHAPGASLADVLVTAACSPARSGSRSSTKSSNQNERCAAWPRSAARGGVLGRAHSLGYERFLRPCLAPPIAHNRRPSF